MRVRARSRTRTSFPDSDVDWCLKVTWLNLPISIAVRGTDSYPRSASALYLHILFCGPYACIHVLYIYFTKYVHHFVRDRVKQMGLSINKFLNSGLLNTVVYNALVHLVPTNGTVPVTQTYSIQCESQISDQLQKWASCPDNQSGDRNRGQVTAFDQSGAFVRATGSCPRSGSHTVSLC
jgi:hypothetical protein